ncbi:MAG TPA: hypothetical protein VGG62_14965 [Terracidiphilus sp.]|jgi:hypothetical protein
MSKVSHITQEQIDAAEAIARVDDSIVRAIMSRVPPSWRLIEHTVSGGAFRRGGIQVLFTVQRYGDGRIWVHASACGRRGENSWFLPDWQDMKRIKNDFVGPERWAYQVFPSEKDYVNQHPYVLHLYALLEGEPALPDFTWGLGCI